MNIIQFLRNMLAPNYEELVFENNDLQKKVKEQDNNIDFLQEDIVTKNKENNLLRSKVFNLELQVSDLSYIPDIDLFCMANYKEIGNISYDQKRKSPNNNDIRITLNELVTPEAFEVKNLFRRIQFNPDRKIYAKKIGDKLAISVTWTDDSNLDTSGDYYLYANETIADKKGDCEDHTFVIMSVSPEFGGCWGFYRGGGHAFNCFVYEDELYILDTVGNKAFITKYSDQTDYDIRFIITAKKTYQVGKATRFGELAGWD